MVVVVVVVFPPLHNPVRVSHFGFPRLPSPDSGLSLSGHLLASERPTTSKVARREPGLIVSVRALLSRSSDCRCCIILEMLSPRSTSCCRCPLSSSCSYHPPPHLLMMGSTFVYQNQRDYEANWTLFSAEDIFLKMKAPLPSTVLITTSQMVK